MPKPITYLLSWLQPLSAQVDGKTMIKLNLNQIRFHLLCDGIGLRLGNIDMAQKKFSYYSLLPYVLTYQLKRMHPMHLIGARD
jgi:hypothetical protein